MLKVADEKTSPERRQVPAAELLPGDDRPRFSEAAFTAPHEGCREPHLWAAPDASSSEHEVTVFLRALTRLLKPRLIIETGSFHGFTTVAFAAALRDNGRGEVVSIELDPEAAAIARERLSDAGLSEWARVIVSSSLDWTPSQPIDLAFLDAGAGWHRAREFLQLRSQMHPDTVVAVHDTSRKSRLPRGAFEALAGRGMLSPIWLPTPRGMLLAQPRWPSRLRSALGLPQYSALYVYSYGRAQAARARSRLRHARG